MIVVKVFNLSKPVNDITRGGVQPVTTGLAKNVVTVSVFVGVDGGTILANVNVEIDPLKYVDVDDALSVASLTALVKSSKKVVVRKFDDRTTRRADAVAALITCLVDAREHIAPVYEKVLNSVTLDILNVDDNDDVNLKVGPR